MSNVSSCGGREQDRSPQPQSPFSLSSSSGACAVVVGRIETKKVRCGEHIMEMEGRDERRHGRWSYRRKETGLSSNASYSISSSAGTIVSRTTYTSSASRPSSLSLSGAAKFVDLELDEDSPCTETEEKEKEKEKDADEFVRPIKKSRLETQKEMTQEEKEIKILVQEFTKGGDTGVLDRWLKHLGVGWVLQGAASASAAAETPSTFDSQRQSWVRALDEITETIRTVASLCDQESEIGIEASTTPDEFQFAQFIQQAILKMLTFVDVTVMAAKDDKTTLLSLEEKYQKLCTLLRVRSALSRTLPRIRYWLSFHSPPSEQVEKIHGEIVSLLSAKQSEAADAIWSTMEEIRIESLEGLSTSLLTPQGSPDIHKSTRSVVSYIEFIWLNSFSMSDIVSEAASRGKYVPHVDPVLPLRSMVVEMISCLQEKLANMSESFAEQCLRFLFLINNFYFIYDTLEGPLLHLKASGQGRARQVLIHMESYLRVSWEPVLSCLRSSTPQCFGRNHSPLSNFLSEFQKTYKTQKHCKIPDPWMRTTLRKAITREIIPSYKQYIEDNKVTTPEFSPLELEEMLQELFEG